MSEAVAIYTLGGEDFLNVRQRLILPALNDPAQVQEAMMDYVRENITGAEKPAAAKRVDRDGSDSRTETAPFG